MRILVVEDEYFLADDLRRDLQRVGGVILGPVGTVGRALELLHRDPPPTGAVLDINLQGEMSWPVADALQDRGIPYVFASGYESDVLPPRFEATPFFRKPVGADALIEALRRVRSDDVRP